jgi:hypothetical protein
MIRYLPIGQTNDDPRRSLEEVENWILEREGHLTQSKQQLAELPTHETLVELSDAFGHGCAPIDVIVRTVTADTLYRRSSIAGNLQRRDTKEKTGVETTHR